MTTTTTELKPQVEVQTPSYDEILGGTREERQAAMAARIERKRRAKRGT